MTGIVYPSEFAARYPRELLARVAGRSTNAGSSIHGPEHWASVAGHGERLAALTAGADAHVVGLFALFHDAMRENDGHDPGHGPRAAQLAQELFRLLDASDEQCALLATACEGHDRGLVSDDPTVGCCWDSDRLDLPRIGLTLELRFFSTDAGRKAARRSRGAGQPV